MRRLEHEMDPAEVRRLLDLLVSRLDAAGIDADIYVFGGSAIALRFPDDAETRFTTDIDAVVRPATEVLRLVARIAEEMRLPPDWLNASGAPFLPPRHRAEPASAGVTLTIADIEDLIAMKLAASREQDLADLGMLARHAGILEPERLVEIAFAAYGEESLVLTESRDDYLMMARQAIDAAARRTTRRSRARSD
ncbi:DUF6036 family nucleotidyltransferase [Homoserinibacter sp. YIM 151385]|uniref:DUF6036 family nucleotidyltransferase n=1 Tax=Homoserinibacter sp. YIM 151385 TaxID=2985506 RepID=UPI0022F082CE|nr:DUF6036 family nucleotidyltransferase [Homoserinibacter sp. YIM 151385]WBU37827.1 DUF6036 family nucleotidyltransferase [Homoserinibacter sp. YIM 151385]